MDQYYANRHKMREPFIGERLIFDFLRLSDEKVSKEAYCFIKNNSYFSIMNNKDKLNNLLYVKDNSILMGGNVFSRAFYRVNVEKEDFSSLPFDKRISIQPIIKGKLENKLSLFNLEGIQFKFVGFYK